MATKQKESQTTEAQLRSQLERYESFFKEIDSFIEFVNDDRDRLKTAIEKELAAKAAYDSAKAEVRELQDSIAGSKDALFRMVAPGPTKFLPLFDRMAEADPEIHGEHASEWRKDPISALRLSPIATQALIDADIVAVGQLQDAVMESASDWWETIDGLTKAMAAAIVDRLNDFIFRDGGRS